MMLPPSHATWSAGHEPRVSSPEFRKMFAYQFCFILCCWLISQKKWEGRRIARTWSPDTI
jgi:hypothetical protein